MHKRLALRFDFGPGINFGNCFDAPNPGEWGWMVSEDDYRKAAEIGSKLIRLPIRWSTHLESNGTIKESFFNQIDQQIALAEKHGLALVINDHHDLSFIENPQLEAPRFISMWTQIASRYRAIHPNLIYELFNEMNGSKMPASEYNELVAQTLDGICAIDHSHLIMVGGINWNNLDGLKTLDVPVRHRQRVVLSWHLYDPQLFTHQGTCKPNTDHGWSEAWHGTEGVSFPGPPSEVLVPCDAASNEKWVSDWFNAYNTVQGPENPASLETFCHLFKEAHDQLLRLIGCLGLSITEFGIYEHAPQHSAENWYHAFIENAEKFGFHWIAWQWKTNFNLVDDSGNPTFRANILFPNLSAQ